MLDPLKLFQNFLIQIPDTISNLQSKVSPYISYRDAIKVQCPLQPFPEFVMESNHTCLLLTSFLSSLIIWLGKMSVFLRKIHFSILADFRDPVQPIYCTLECDTEAVKTCV